MQKNSPEFVQYYQKQAGIYFLALLGIVAMISAHLWASDVLTLVLWGTVFPAAVLWVTHVAAAIYFARRGEMKTMFRWWMLLFLVGFFVVQLLYWMQYADFFRDLANFN